MSHFPLEIENLGRVDYVQTFEKMRAYTQARSASSRDRVWLCQHPAVYTQGLAGRQEHILSAAFLDEIEVVQTDRGGQVTYHGPGQLVAYPLLDLRRRGYYVKEYVYRLEEAILRTLAHWHITGYRVRGAPGIYVDSESPFSHRRLDLHEKDLRAMAQTASSAQDKTASAGPRLAKIAALGIKVSQKGCYHGLSLNVDMDLRPFLAINPCGYANLKTVDMVSLGVPASCDAVAERLGLALQALL